MVLVYVFSVNLHWLPSIGWRSLHHGLWPNLDHLILPVFVLGLPLAALVSRMLRGEMLEVMHQVYILVARAKGLSEYAVLIRHTVRNAILAVVTVLGLQIGFLLSGAVITEVIFGLPGMGQLVYDAIIQRDYPVLDGEVFFMAIMVLLTNLIVDVVYVLMDPRIRYV